MTYEELKIWLAEMALNYAYMVDDEVFKRLKGGKNGRSNRKTTKIYESARD